MQEHRISSRAQRALVATNCDTLVVSDPATVTWLTGFAPEVIFGPSPFAAPPLVVVRTGGDVVAIVSSDQAPSVTACDVVSYEGFTTGPLAPYEGQRIALRSIACSGRIGVDTLVLPGLLESSGTQDVGTTLDRLRAVKDAYELERIRAAVKLCDVGQATARARVLAGSRELELWSSIQSAMEAHAGERLPLLCDVVSGPRSAEVGGPPTVRTLERGDLVIVDLVPRLHGYWGDSCATLTTGNPPIAAREAHAQCVAALERGIAAVRPGVVAGELDALIRAGLDYPHHSGHGLGTTLHEEPRIVPGSTTVLEAGMVIALEPAAYHDSWGVRVERVVAVTETGCEILSGHDIDLG